MKEQGSTQNSQKLGVSQGEVEHFVSACKRTASKMGVEAEEYAKAAVNLTKTNQLKTALKQKKRGYG